MEKIKKYKFEILIFVVEAVCMILELVASRVLSPYFGNSQVVWTSVIAIILFSSSIGNYFGGKVADNEDRIEKLRLILLSAAILTLIVPFVSTSLIDTVSSVIHNIKIGAIVATACLFLAPSVFLGMIPPIILKQKLQDLDNAGKTSGKINALSTIGGIVGTILGGFFLVPNFGCLQILFVLSVILTVLALASDKTNNKKVIVFLLFLIAVGISGAIVTFYKNNSMEGRVLSGEENATISYDTEYGRALIRNRELNGELVRRMEIDGGYESATYIDEKLKNELVFEYAKQYDVMFDIKRDVNNVMMIGGAGYSYPKYYISHYLDKNMDVVEIDSKVTELAKKYFYLNDLIKEYDLENNKRLNLINEDGRTFLNSNNKKYDAILNDAFAGEIPAKVLTTKEAVERIKDSLVDDGVYMTNIIAGQTDETTRFIKAEVNTIRQVFKNVYVIPVLNRDETLETYNKNIYRNNIVVATDQDIKLENTIELHIKSNEMILTDDFCPVEVLAQR